MITESRIVAHRTAADGTTYRVVLDRDTDTARLDPRKTDVNAGLIFASGSGPRELPSSLDDYRLAEAVETFDFPVVARWLRVFHGATIVLPLYGSPQGLSAGEPWETPQAGEYAGVTFDTPLTLAETGLTHDGPDRIADALAEDVEHYATWARGDVFTWTVQWADRDTETGELIRWVDAQTCRGHIGQAWAEDAARGGLDAVVHFANVDRPATVEV